jgi:hypothetical protein
LAKIVYDDFGGHYSEGRRQKAWFLPAASCRTSATILADITPKAAGKKRGFCRLRPAEPLRRSWQTLLRNPAAATLRYLAVNLNFWPATVA